MAFLGLCAPSLTSNRKKASPFPRGHIRCHCLVCDRGSALQPITVGQVLCIYFVMLPAHQRSLQSDAALATSYWKEREWLLRRQKHQCPLDAGGRSTHSLWSFCPQGLERHSRATTFKSQSSSSGSKRSRNSAVAAHVPRSRRSLRAPCVVLAQGVVGPIQDGSGELPILGHWPMVLVTAASPEAVRADGEGEEGRDQSALCRLASSPGLRVGRETSCLSPLSLLLCFFSPAGSRAGFPSRVTTQVLGILEVVYTTAAWRKGEKKQPVPLRGIFWGLVENDLQAPSPLGLWACSEPTWTVCT